MISNRGYVWIIVKDHPRANRDGYVAEHRLVAEKALGRYLEPEHPIHHFDNSPANNANTNLVICEDQTYHKLLHQRQTVLIACGNAGALKCDLCHNWHRQEEVRAYSYGKGPGRYGRHLSCNRDRAKQYAKART